MTTPRPSPVSIRLGELAPLVAERGVSPGAVLSRDIRRYYAQLASALREVRFSRAEWDFLRDILNGSVVDDLLVRHLAAEVEDEDPETATAHGVDQRDLAGRIRTLSDFHRLAICDAIERWWIAQPQQQETPR